MSRLRSPNRKRTCLPTALILAAGIPPAGPPRVAALAQTGDRRPAGAEPPTEETRLNTGVFRAGLRKRGLTELLELHLREFPPTDAIEFSLMLRDVKLADAADPNRKRGERQALLADANRLLEKTIEEHPDDTRRWDWRLKLARSLIYEEAAPFLTNILYRGGTDADRAAALASTPRAVGVVRPVMEELDAEYRRIDELSVHDFERLESQGYVETLDRLAPEAEYLLLWGLFYDALPRAAEDPTRAANLFEIDERVEANPALVETPHEVSRIQVPMLLLSGMVQRRLNRPEPARDLFAQALTAAAAVQDPAERERIQWAVSLAWIERIGNEADDRRFSDALRRVGELRATIPPSAPEGFHLRLTCALLERSIHRLRIAAGPSAGSAEDVGEVRKKAWRPLAELARAEPARRAEVYAAVYAILGSDAPVERLDPFEQAALMAGLLTEVEQGAADADRLLARTVAVGERFLAIAGSDGAELTPEVLFNLGVAQFRRGRLAAAAGRFLELAVNHRSFDRTAEAVTYAVQLAAQLYADPDLGAGPDREAVAQLYRQALAELLDTFPDSAAGKYWRIHYGQLLEDSGEFDAAAAQYALVDESHEHAVEAAFSRLRCLYQTVRRWTESSASDAGAIQVRADEFFTASRALSEAVARARTSPSEPERGATLDRLSAEATVMKAELQLLPQLDRAGGAIATLRDLDPSRLTDPPLVARLWRARLIAYERTGQLAEAVEAIDRYRDADPAHFGATLQPLYTTLAAEADRLQIDGNAAAAQRRAEMARILATQIYEWTRRSGSAASSEEQRAAAVQRADAELRAGSVERALELFEALAETDSSHAEAAADARVLFGRAQALARLGRLKEALPEFNRLAVGLPVDEPLRWAALLEDLKTRTELGHPAQGIVGVIEQQKRLHPTMGGPTIAVQFEKVLRENRRRLELGP